jgi:hypothetical protein
MPSPIVNENWQPGTEDWRIASPALAHEIEGFVSTTSALPGETIGFFVSTTAPNFSVQIFRMGWYGGAGGRLMMTVQQLPGMDQSAATALDPMFGTVNCTDWQQSYSLRIPEDWVSGVYLAKLSTIPSSGPPLEQYLIFVVRAPYSPDLLWASPVNTYQAYNYWQGNMNLGASLYDNFVSGPNSGKHVNAVSFNRPYADGLGSGHFFYFEYPFLFWLEGNGYDVTYASSEDLHARRATFPKAALLSPGHDEYWSFEMRSAVESAISSGLSVGFFGANPMYWQVRFDEDTDLGAINRNMVCYKYIPHCQMPDGSSCYDPSGAPKDPNNQIGIDPWDQPGATFYQRVRLTARWRDLLLGRPEQNAVGQMYQDHVRSPGAAFPWVVSDDSHWVFAGTGLSNGDQVGSIVGGEFDRVFNNDEPDLSTPDLIPVSTPPGMQILSRSGFNNGIAGDQYSTTTIYQAPSGAWVFSAGTLLWSWGLADLDGIGPVGFPYYTVTHNVADERLQLVTANILNTVITGTKPAAAGGPRIGVLQNGTLFVKEGPLDAAWWVQGTRVTAFALDGDRIGALTLDGGVFVRARLFGTAFVWESSPAQSFVLDGDRIGVLDSDGDLYVKEGPLDAAWVWESSNVQSFALDSGRIGVLDTAGNVNVKEGPLDAAWVWESSNVQSFALNGGRIGVLQNGTLFVKEGPLDAAWTEESSSVQSFALDGGRIGVLDTAGNVNVKEGPLDAAWVWESSNVQSFTLNG